MWAKHITSPNVRFFTFWLLLTVIHARIWGEKRLTLKPATSWFALRAWKRRTSHRWTPRHIRVLSQCFGLHSVPCLCQTHKDSSTWLFVASAGNDICILFPLLHWQNKAADSLVTLCKYIYIYIFILIISIYSIYRISLCSIYILLVGLLKDSGTFTWPCDFFLFFFIWKIHTDRR